jgi:type VI secretion system secreted protein VgrG
MFGRYYRYHAVVRPWLWFLSRTADCRIFQDMTVPDIVKTVFGTIDRRRHVRADRYLPEVELLRPVSRDRPEFRQPAARARGDLLLLQVHGDAEHAVLTDSYSGHETFPGAEVLPFIDPERLCGPISSMSGRGISAARCSRRLRP